MFNRSLSEGNFPAVFKEASITPVMKKRGLDAADTSSYRSISNLPVLSKLLEHLVVRQLMGYLSSADLLPSLQSGFRQGHSTETAVLRVLSDILQSVDRGDTAALILLDLSAAFDTVESTMRSCYTGCRQFLALMTVLIDRLSPTSQAGISTYAAGLRNQPSFTSSAVCLRVLCCRDQFCWSCKLYTVELISLIERHGLSPQLYADDTQVYGPCPPAAVDALSSQVTECADDIATWMKSNRLQLCPDKTEVLWCATSRRQHQLPFTGMLINGVHITPVKSVRDLDRHLHRS